MLELHERPGKNSKGIQDAKYTAIPTRYKIKPVLWFLRFRLNVMSNGSENSNTLNMFSPYLTAAGILSQNISGWNSGGRRPANARFHTMTGIVSTIPLENILVVPFFISAAP
jgi:hypothetical protein